MSDDDRYVAEDGPLNEEWLTKALEQYGKIDKVPVEMDFATLEGFTGEITKLRDENTRLRGELAEATSLMSRMLMASKKVIGDTAVYKLAREFVLRMPKATQ